MFQFMFKQQPFTASLVVIVLLFILLPTAVQASGSALTAPPPPSSSTDSIFNSNHVYLDSGSSSISKGAGQATIAGSTYANRVVDTIGMTLYLQRWTGSIWVDVGSGTPLSKANATSHTGSVIRATDAGYYYRTRAVHTITEGGVTETGETFSSSVLAS
ncbi:DUF6147 family protein [Paenibacillus sp. GCM10023252]|uniref:DUF6147 family protein n=1 Tax=Paenibacillus sp. GCM10023252 TaxID=3252649 RepID=UPI0036100D2A